MQKKRVYELEAAKSKLLKQQAQKQAEIESAKAKGKQEGRVEMINKFSEGLPSSNSTYVQGAARALVRDVRKVLAEMEEKNKQ